MKGEEHLWGVLNDKLDTLRATNQMAEAIRVGQSEEAIDFYEQAVAAAPQIPELPFSDLGALLNNVALICRKAGRAKAAEPYYLRALQIYENQLGPEHPDVASVLNNLGVFYTN